MATDKMLQTRNNADIQRRKGIIAYTGKGGVGINCFCSIRSLASKKGY